MHAFSAYTFIAAFSGHIELTWLPYLKNYAFLTGVAFMNKIFYLTSNSKLITFIDIVEPVIG